MSDGDPLWAATKPEAPAGTVAATSFAPRLDGSPHTPSSGVPKIVRRRRWPRRLAVLLLGVLLLAAAYFLVTLYQVWSTGRTDQARPVDAIVVLGAAQYDGTPSPQLRARLDHALELYQAGDAPFVVVTGGNQPGDRFTEAEASARYLIERGVPEEAILQETEGGSTWESMAGVSEVLAPLGLERVLLVSDPFHLLRSRLIAEEVGLEAYTSPSSGGPVRGGENVVKHLKEAAGISVGRVIGFERLWGITG